MMRICMLGHKRIPSREGGIEIVVEELSTRMAKLGHEVTCYNRSGHHISGRKFDQEKIKKYKDVTIKTVLTLNYKGIAAVTSSIFGGIRAALGCYDVVHFHAEGPCAMLWLPKLMGKRCIATIHGLDHQRAKWGKFARLYILLGEKCAVKFADEIIVLSEGVQQYFFNRYGRKTKFIPNGVNRLENKKAELIIKKYGLKKDSYILFLGRLVPEKGIDYLIEAFKRISTDKKLVIAGGSSDAEEYESKLKELSQNDNRIIFTGFVQGQELEELFSNAYIYTLPSDLEGMPLSLLEAMCYGNCCVVSDIDECVEVVENNAFTFKKSNIYDLQDKLQFAIENQDEVMKIKSNSAEFICAKYNWDDVVNKTLELYKSL